MVKKKCKEHQQRRQLYKEKKIMDHQKAWEEIVHELMSTFSFIARSFARIFLSIQTLYSSWSD